MLNFKKVAMYLKADIAEQNEIVKKVIDKMKIWKKHDKKTFDSIKDLFKFSIAKADAKMLGELRIHFGMKEEEIALVKKYGYTIYKAIKDI